MTAIVLCEVCGREPHSETANTLSVSCHGCRRRTCPDCQRLMIGDYGWPVGGYCIDCQVRTEEEFRSPGLDPPRFERPFVGKVDAVGRPILRAEVLTAWHEERSACRLP